MNKMRHVYKDPTETFKEQINNPTTSLKPERGEKQCADFCLHTTIQLELNYQNDGAIIASRKASKDVQPERHALSGFDLTEEHP